MDHWYTRWALALASDIRLGQLNSCSRLLCCPPSALQCRLSWAQLQHGIQINLFSLADPSFGVSRISAALGFHPFTRRPLISLYLLTSSWNPGRSLGGPNDWPLIASNHSRSAFMAWW
jgi:hypothetical protein